MSKNFKRNSLKLRVLVGLPLVMLLINVQLAGSGGRPAAQSRGKNAPKAPSYEGYFDFAGCDYIAGWVRDIKSPEVRLTVSVVDDSGQVIASGPAENLRPDLVEAGKGDGKYSFTFETPDSIKNGQSHIVMIKVVGTQFSLPGGPKSLSCKKAP